MQKLLRVLNPKRKALEKKQREQQDWEQRQQQEQQSSRLGGTAAISPAVASQQHSHEQVSNHTPVPVAKVGAAAALNQSDAEQGTDSTGQQNAMNSTKEKRREWVLQAQDQVGNEARNSLRKVVARKSSFVLGDLHYGHADDEHADEPHAPSAYNTAAHNTYNLCFRFSCAGSHKLGLRRV